MIVSLSPMASLLYSLPFFAFILSLPLNQGNHETAKPKVVMEEGYMVTTLIDGHKLKINPHEVLSRPGTSDLLILDSSGSAFYTVSFPISQGAAVNRFLGDGIAGYLDGELSSARFNGPRSFAVDLKGNVYVADKINRVIRKISGSGVTTIAGNYSKEGKADGPGKVASFSNDFELAFIPEKCVLLVSDHGNQLVRQINLKPEDCVRGSHSALGAVSVWALGLGLSCLIGMIIGIVVRPYVIPHTGSVQRTSFQADMEALPNHFGETSADNLLRHQKRSC
ncbi:hypothetical protein K2173_003192 [Erythroxylum novogranatense]|uniref:NHL repeat-containing protein n=1 Tax=Erythroxylum novogranatense TaxID=1862640 RepID=A0AAV8SYF9_9ROSI|nr:hypothetical protein K2173_003192 [Erythroxylum novogranatense]